MLGAGGVESLQLRQVAATRETTIQSNVSTFVHMKPPDNLKETLGHLSAVFVGTELYLFDQKARNPPAVFGQWNWILLARGQSIVFAVIVATKLDILDEKSGNFLSVFFANLHRISKLHRIGNHQVSPMTVWPQSVLQYSVFIRRERLWCESITSTTMST